MLINEKLKTVLKDIDPEQEVFTESVVSKLSEIVEERASELMEAMDSDHAEKLEEAIKHVRKQAEVAQQAALDRMDEDHAEKLEEAIKQLNERAEADKQAALDRMDEDHAEKMKHALDVIDEDHTNKAKQMIESIDSEHAEKLQKVIDTLTVKRIDEGLVDQVSDYLDTYLAESIPAGKEIEFEKLHRLEKIFNEARELFSVTDDYVQSEVAEALQEAKTRMDEQEAEINSLMLEKIKLNKQLKANEAHDELESKIEHLTESEKSFVRSHLDGKDVDQISEQAVNEAVKAYEKMLKENRDKARARSNKHKRLLHERRNEPTRAPRKPADDNGDALIDMYVDVIDKTRI
jgi:hypothetical protein